jgi:hypothetical protein
MNVHRGILVVLACTLAAAACGPDAPSASPSTAVIADISPLPSPSPSTAPGASAKPSPSPSARPTATPAATPTPAPTPTPTPTPWNAYTSKRFHYKIQYPPGWVVTPGSARLSDAFDAYDYPYVYVARDTVSGIASVSLTITSDVAYLKSHYKAKVVSNKAIKLAGWPGRIITLRGSDKGLAVLIQHIIVAKGRVGYTIDMWGEYAKAAADRALFKRIYGTWRAT